MGGDFKGIKCMALWNQQNTHYFTITCELQNVYCEYTHKN